MPKGSDRSESMLSEKVVRENARAFVSLLEQLEELFGIPHRSGRSGNLETEIGRIPTCGYQGRRPPGRTTPTTTAQARKGTERSSRNDRSARWNNPAKRMEAQHANPTSTSRMAPRRKQSRKTPKAETARP